LAQSTSIASAFRGWTGRDYSRAYLNLFVPMWLISVLLGLLPLAALLRLGSRRSGVGRCEHCGYDLRATPDRCPECGTASVKMAAP
jgi:hypothetical protein